ncbi:class I SAM-dependent methyltransferase [Phaeodactylibacter luteus]|uniref:Class I SAM-dependent methyltransferase n=1 Tax=Phaeodactylibacter luteus TaxID=1564516 RepID=A0A5C6RJ82_9BACT|nr:class I SAM-dependent methyltransferase [Phaeodactylibacter luteus]TXB62486.1 class I SAM-dependent methyltransferase [Phaeodactylibacter luteus]
MTYRLLFWCLALLLGLSSCGAEQSTETDAPFSTESQADTPSLPAPPPAREAAPQLKEMYENTNRVAWQKPEMIINLLGDLNQKVVADIGAGTGFFAKRLTQDADKVIAIDIDQRFLNYIDSVKVLEMTEERAAKLETRLAKPSHPNLQPEEADVILIVNTFMYIRDKEGYLNTLRACLRPGGRLIIVDFKRKRTQIGPPSAIRLPLYQLEEMLYEAGYSNITTNDTALDYQYIISGSK